MENYNFDLINHKLQKYMIKLDKAYKNGDYENVALYKQKYDYYVNLIGGAKTLEQIINDVKGVSTYRVSTDDITNFEQLKKRIIDMKIDPSVGATFDTILADIDESITAAATGNSGAGAGAGAGAGPAKPPPAYGEIPHESTVFTFENLKNQKQRENLSKKYNEKWYMDDDKRTLVYIDTRFKNKRIVIPMIKDEDSGTYYSNTIKYGFNITSLNKLKIGDCFQKTIDSKFIYEFKGYIKYNYNDGTVKCTVEKTERTHDGISKEPIIDNNFSVNELLNIEKKDCAKATKILNRKTIPTNQWINVRYKNKPVMYYKGDGLTLIVDMNEKYIYIKNRNITIKLADCFTLGSNAENCRLLDITFVNGQIVCKFIRRNQSVSENLISIARNIKTSNCGGQFDNAGQRISNIWFKTDSKSLNIYQYIIDSNISIIVDLDLKTFKVKRSNDVVSYTSGTCFTITDETDKIYKFDGNIYHDNFTNFKINDIHYILRDDKTHIRAKTGRVFKDKISLADIATKITKSICQIQKTKTGQCIYQKNNRAPSFKVLSKPFFGNYKVTKMDGEFIPGGYKLQSGDKVDSCEKPVTANATGFF